MKTRFYQLAFIALSFTAMVSCKKDEQVNTIVASHAKLDKVDHSYSYKGKEYSVSLYFDKDNKVVKVEGDTEKHLKNVATANKGVSAAYLISKNANSPTGYEIKMFDSEMEMNKYQNVSISKLSGGNKTNCTDWISPGGNATFRFYAHINYQGLFTDLSAENCSYFQDQWLDGANNQISSIEVIGLNGSGAAVTLFTGSCFSGSPYRFLDNVPNLHHVMYNFNNINQLTVPINIGDDISSLKGWSL